MIDKTKNLRRHLQTQIAVANEIDSQFVYITKSEAIKCLELAEQESLVESLNERKAYETRRKAVRCKDCKYYHEQGHYCGYTTAWEKNLSHSLVLRCSPEWFCADGERK